MSKKLNKSKASVSVVPEIKLSPVQKVEMFLAKEGLQVFVNLYHKQLWRCRIIHFVAKALNVSIAPAVREAIKLPSESVK